ncbi:MAG TPA: pantoate--beta-alanine ligase [Nevskiaceae bacterium]|nr:pantoate--beta-alanine ligase [Nevskiaceae bacterium]
MRTVHTVAELRATVAAWRKAGDRIAFVPTMGNLHAGHLDLVRRARELAPRVVCSIFVNPLQFGPNEDFDRYPRTLAEDSAKLAGVGCDLVFAPSVAEMYPNGRDGMTGVKVPGVSDILEGHFRPGFFDGVATVVSVLFHQVLPDVAVFGQKDWQQLLIVKRMVADLHFPLEIVGHPTMREADGLAMSSRNQYLSPQERALAPEMHRTLQGVVQGLREGRRDFPALAGEATVRLAGLGFQPQYVEIRHLDLSAPSAESSEWVVLAAAFLGKTRLIDNVAISLEKK